MNKVCTKCKQVKPISAFIGRKRRRRKKYSVCNQCREVYVQRYRDKLKQRQLEIRIYIYKYLLEHSCACGENAPEVLEFDHRRDKKFNISHAAKMGYNLHAVKKEIEKTVVMCSNCHRRRTAKEQNWYAEIKNIIEERKING